MDMAAEIQKVLDRHGFGFHYAVMRRGEELFQSKRSRWRLVGAEYPVQLGGTVTHVDFVYEQGNDALTLLMVAECKRVDPALGRWSFIAAPYTWFDPDDSELAFDELQCRKSEYGIAHTPRFAYSKRTVYRIAREMKVQVTGSGQGKTRDGAIDDAVAQALRGSGGLLATLRGDPKRFSDRSMRYRFIPVVFTTAELWVSDIDLGASNLETGAVPKGNAKRATWVWYVHNRSASLAPTSPPVEPGQGLSTDLRDALRSNAARAVAIVGSNGIDEFLSVLPDWK